MKQRNEEGSQRIMVENGKITDEQDRRYAVLANAVTLIANESLVLAQYEATAQQGQFAKLCLESDKGVFDKRVNQVIEHLGGPPEFYIVTEDQEQKIPPGDNYPEAVMREVFSVFSRARKSVIRAHLFQAGSSLITAHPNLLNFPDNPTKQVWFIEQAQAAFWEHAEAAYIWLYSFWDRLGQVLDFSFFNIRKFDQNGFTSVMDRIHLNAVPMDDLLKNSTSWKRLRSFQTSEKEDGLKWLLQRRNLIVHSLHLHPVQTNEESVFKSQYNHLEIAYRDKLRPKSPEEEAGLLLGQLNKAGDLFNDFLTVVEFSPSRKQDRFLF
ncbi:hypothetical protein [Acerihabitans arboris]|uniref:Cthe-2314-like HEPN domain-containing protein n=1 Tax=Acerihabitans arboris TaxID=2691583 RepID=A0A845SKF8_9GAMM|nr:hypothetical protein [Acerihabitans arboris]NDL65763.1 hypothetical protein [Acerihabitans arboris]